MCLNWNRRTLRTIEDDQVKAVIDILTATSSIPERNPFAVGSSPTRPAVGGNDMGIKEDNNTWGESWRDKPLLIVRRLRDDGFNEKQIKQILEEINDICHDCWDADDGCQCRNDE